MLSKKIAKYRLPNREKDLDILANTIYTYANPHITGPIPGSHVHSRRSRILGRPSRSKTPYKMAVFQAIIRSPDDGEPVLDSKKPWSQDIINVNGPFEIHHKPEHIGKTAYYRARWQAPSGVRGHGKRPHPLPVGLCPPPRYERGFAPRFFSHFFVFF